MKIWKEKDKKLRNKYIWRADFTCKGKRKKPWAYSKDELEQLITQIKSNATKAKHGLATNAPKITTEDLVAEHIKDFDLTVEYYRRGKVVLEMFRDHVGSETPVDKISTVDFRTYIRERRRKNPKLQNSSINKDLTYLSKLLSDAPELFKELADFKSPKIPWQTESKKPNDRVIYQEESDKLLAFLRDPEVHPGEKPNSPEIRGDYADMYEIAMNTAMRWGEIAQLEFSMLNVKAGEIVLPKEIAKTDEPRIVPMNARVKEILTRRQKSQWTQWVFPRADGKTYRKYYYDRLRSICKKLGLPFGRKIGFVLHTTRHSVATKLLVKTGDFSAVQRILGHSDSSMTARYSHFTNERLHAAVNALDEPQTTTTSNKSRTGKSKAAGNSSK